MTELSSGNRDHVMKRSKVFTTKLFMGKVFRLQSQTLGQRIVSAFHKVFKSANTGRAVQLTEEQTSMVFVYILYLPGRHLPTMILYPRLLSSKRGHVKRLANNMWVKMVSISRREFSRSRSSFSCAFYPAGSGGWQSHRTWRAWGPGPCVRGSNQPTRNTCFGLLFE